MENRKICSFQISIDDNQFNLLLRLLHVHDSSANNLFRIRRVYL